MIAAAAAALLLLVILPFAQAGKRGLCWPWYNGDLNPGKFNNGHTEVIAIYDYETYQPPSTNGTGGFEFIGMQRCLDCDSSPVNQLFARQKSQGWKTVFSLNEPDINGITPSRAAAWYITYMNPMAIKKALPSVTSSTLKGQGLDWVAQMITVCAGKCYFDYINLHWYGASFTEFQAYVKLAHSRFPKFKLVITEFALQSPSGKQAAQIAFYKQAFRWLDSVNYVKLYFPFVATTPQLFASHDPAGSKYVDTSSCLYENDGSVSALGKLMTSTVI